MREQKAEGWDLLKVHPGVRRETYDAMVATARAEGISRAAGALSLIDVAAGLADLAETESWSRPRVIGDHAHRDVARRHA